MNPKYDLGLPNAVKNKTYADASKHIESMFKNRNSVIDINTKKTLLSRLKDAQEAEREKLEQKQIKTNSVNQMANGGPPLNPNLFKLDSNVLDEIESNNMSFNNNDDITPNTPVGTVQSTPENPMKNWFSRNKSNIGVGIGAGIMALAPMIANRRAMKSLQKPTTINPMLLDEQQITPEYVNRQQLLRNVTEQGASQRYLMNQMGGDWNQKMSMMSNLNASMMGTKGNLMLQSDLADIGERQRVQGLRSNFQQFNIGQRQRAEEMNAQNQAAYSNQIAAYKQATGANIGAVGQSLLNFLQAKQYAKYAGYADKLSKTQ